MTIVKSAGIVLKLELCVVMLQLCSVPIRLVLIEKPSDV